MPGHSSVPSIVKVFPAPVAPYAKTDQQCYLQGTILYHKYFQKIYTVNQTGFEVSTGNHNSS